MGRSAEWAQQEQERDNLSGMAEYEEWYAQQQALPAHKRDGYAERVYEQADDARKAARENCPF